MNRNNQNFNLDQDDDFSLDSETKAENSQDLHKNLNQIDLDKLSKAEIEQLLNRYNQDFAESEDDEYIIQEDEETEANFDQYSKNSFSDSLNKKPFAEYKKGRNLLEKIKFIPHNLKTFLTIHKKPVRLLFMAFVFFGLAVVGALSIWVYGIYADIEGGIAERATRISEGSIVYDKNGEEMFKFSGDIQREVVGLNEIPEKMQLAMIALEDENFYENEAGIPWQNLVGAIARCGLSRGRECRGGSGLSQQLIKNVTDDDDRSIERKVRELFTAMRFNQELPGTVEDKQDKVLELYLNWVPFGRNTYGVRAASKSYFGHDINSEDLTIPEACYLASMPQIPSLYAEGIRLEIVNRDRIEKGEEPLPNPNFDRLETRKNFCIDKLHELKLANRGTKRFIQTKEEADKLKKEKVNFKPLVITEKISYGHIRNYLSSEIERKFNDRTENAITASNLETKGYRIYTTLDKKMQDDLEKILLEASEVETAGGNNAAGVVLHGETGEIRAMLGSRDFNNEEIGGQVNVLTAPRQPGSSFKPYVYAAAFENDFNPSTVLLDVSTDFGGGYRPKNFSNTFSGVTTIRRSLQDSLNIPAIKSAYLAQAPSNTPNTASAATNMLDFAQRLGVKMPFREKCDITAALGGCEVEHLSHATAINTILQQGVKKEPRLISRIELRNTQLFSEDQIKQKYQSQQVISPGIANQITNIMSDYASRSPSVWGNLRFNLQLEGWDGANSVAAKTGTTNDVRDMWTVGGSKEYTVTLWIGNTDNKPMNPTVSAAKLSAPVWNRMMKRVHQGISPKPFSRTGLQAVGIDPQTGLLGEGRTELLTQSQITRLQEAQKRLNNPSYNPLENSIFNNRTPITRREVTVNKIDNKLIPNQETEEKVVDFEFPESLIEKIECRGVVSEFPTNSNWRTPAEALTLGENNGVCPTETTTLTLADIQPKITTNLLPNTKAPETITITSESGINNNILEKDNRITSIQVKVNNQIIASSETAQLTILTAKISLTGIQNLEIIVTDSFGFKSTLKIQGVNFTPVITDPAIGGGTTEENEKEVDPSPDPNPTPNPSPNPNP